MIDFTLLNTGPNIIAFLVWLTVLGGLSGWLLAYSLTTQENHKIWIKGMCLRITITLAVLFAGTATITMASAYRPKTQIKHPVASEDRATQRREGVEPVKPATPMTPLEESILDLTRSRKQNSDAVKQFDNVD